MPFSSLWARRRGAVLLLAGVLALAVGCSGSSSDSAAAETLYTISGKVTYQRAPLVKDAAGVPTGIATDAASLVSKPARGIRLRLFQQREQALPDSTKVLVWTLVTTTVTNDSGEYSFEKIVAKDQPTFVELVGSGQTGSSPAAVITLVSDPDGVYSQRPISQRPVYFQRKAPNGTAGNFPSSTVSADATLDWAVNLDDPWLVATNAWYGDGRGPFPAPEAVAAGSRIPAILDSFYTFGATYGLPVPSASATTVFVHYRPGVSVGRGTFISSELKAFPLSFDGSSFHHFGAISGGGVLAGVPQADDAFNEGVLFPVMALGHLHSQGKASLPARGERMTSLAPDLALVEGLADAMAANLLKSPYLAGLSAAARFPCRDIRDLSALSDAQKGRCSAPTLSALAWELILVNHKVTGAGTVTDWNAFDPLNIRRLFGLVEATSTENSRTVTIDRANTLMQLGRLQESKGSTETSDLAAFFGDAVLTPLAARFNITWTNLTNAKLPQATTNLGGDPDTLVTAIPPFTLSMAKAQQVQRYGLDPDSGLETVETRYPNTSEGEIWFGRFSLGNDRRFRIRPVVGTPLPAGAAIEVRIDNSDAATFLFDAANPGPVEVVLRGNPVATDTPALHWIQIRLISPQVLVPDTQVTLRMDKVQ